MKVLSEASEKPRLSSFQNTGPNLTSLMPGTRETKKAAYSVVGQAFVIQQCLWLTNKVELFQATFEYVPSHLQFSTGQKEEES